MKAIAAIMTILVFFGCSESLLQDSTTKSNHKIVPRSNQNELVFESGFGSVGTFNSTTGEWEVLLSTNFEIQPYGSLSWFSFGGPKKLKYKCHCWSTCTGGECEPTLIFSDPVTLQCDNGCIGWECGCTMTLRVTSTDDNNTISSFEGGAQVRPIQ